LRLPPQPSRSPIEPTLALINVVFLLLLFFVVTGTVVYQHDRSIVPPTSFLLTAGKPPVDAIYIGADGQLSFRGERQAAADIARALRDGAEGLGAGDVVARPVQVVADRNLRAQLLLAIAADLRNHGLHSLTFVTVRDDGS
jgi:biopolymer transport protein ExbD